MMNTPTTHPGTASAQASRIPGPRRAHFSQGGIKGGGANIGSGVTAAIIPTAILGGIALAVAGFFALARYPWMPLAVRATVMTVVFLVLIIALFRVAARGYRRTMSSLKLPMEMDPGADLNVICWPDQKQRLEAYLPPPGDPGYFEPEACRVWVARRTSLAARLQTRKQQVRYTALIVTLVLLLQAGAHLGARGFIDPAAIAAVIGIGLLIPVLWGFARPIYLRIAPGRVDVIRFGWFGSTPSVETHDLREHPVRLDLRRKELLIGGWHPMHPDPEPESEHPPEPQPEAENTKAEKSTPESMFMANQSGKDSQAVMGSPAQIRALTIIPLWASLDVRTIEDAVFRASVSTADPGPLPDDRLID